MTISLLMTGKLNLIKLQSKKRGAGELKEILQLENLIFIVS